MRLQKDGTIFNIVVLFSYLLLFSVLILIVGSKLGGPLTRIEASNVHRFLEWVGIGNVLMGNMIYLPGEGLSFEITWQCSGTFSITLYTVVYLLLPRIRRDFWGWFFGSAVLYFTNFLRVVSIIYVYQRFGERMFLLFHYVIGPSIMFTMVVILLGVALLRGLKSV